MAVYNLSAVCSQCFSTFLLTSTSRPLGLIFNDHTDHLCVFLVYVYNKAYYGKAPSTLITRKGTTLHRLTPLSRIPVLLHMSSNTL